MPEIVYDTGALLAAERRDARLWALHAELIAADTIPIVPALGLRIPMRAV